MKNPEISKVEKSGFCDLCKLSESVTVDEVVNYLVITDVPCKLVLIDAIGEGIAELVDDSVQARLSGIGLPTTVKHTNEVITNLSDLVVVKVHSRHTFVVLNTSVRHAPVSVVLDGDVHETLNLTHGESSEVYVVNWTDCRSGSSQQGHSEHVTQSVKVVEALVILDEGAVKGTVKGSDVTLNVSDGGSDGAGSDSGGHGGCLN